VCGAGLLGTIINPLVTIRCAGVAEILNVAKKMKLELENDLVRELSSVKILAIMNKLLFKK
jgi:hypothetical protein